MKGASDDEADAEDEQSAAKSASDDEQNGSQSCQASFPAEPLKAFERP